MTNTQRGPNLTAVLICITALAIIAMGAILAIFISSEDNDVALGRAGIITGFVGILIPQMFLIMRQNSISDATDQINAKVDRVNETVDEVNNGAFQSRVEKTMHKVLAKRDAEWQSNKDNPGLDSDSIPRRPGL